MAESFLGRLRDARGGPRPIKIGVLTTRTGPLDYYGTMQVQGLELGIGHADGTGVTVEDERLVFHGAVSFLHGFVNIFTLVHMVLLQPEV